MKFHATSFGFGSGVLSSRKNPGNVATLMTTDGGFHRGYAVIADQVKT
jgi:hypothetical protein